MALIKCKECGQMVSDKASECPNCGCSIKVDDTTKSSKCKFDMEGSAFSTTNTGRSNEEIIKSLGEGIWIWTLILCLFGILGFAFWGIIETEAKALLGILGLILLILWARIIRAFLLVLHNISINLHEINMKLK